MFSADKEKKHINKIPISSCSVESDVSDSRVIDPRTPESGVRISYLWKNNEQKETKLLVTEKAQRNTHAHMHAHFYKECIHHHLNGVMWVIYFS